MMSKLICSSVILLWLAGSASCATLYVDGAVSSSGDGTSWGTALKTIQEGIDSASAGDTVVVARGNYHQNIAFKGKNIVLTSEDPGSPFVVDGTRIIASQPGSVVTFLGTENVTCALIGFTITNGDEEYGGGIFGGGVADHTQARIRNNVITGNSAGLSGGGIAFCDGLIQNNTITGNSAGVDGGGLYDCGGTIEYNTITENDAGGRGGGISICHGTIRRNTVRGNLACRGGGLHGCLGSIQFNTISHNQAASSPGETWGGGLYDCNGTVSYNRIQQNSAATYGGGMYGCDGPIRNNLILGNRAISGGGIDLCGGTVENNTIVGNTAMMDGGGGGLTWRTGSVRNCIIWGNTGPLGDPDDVDGSNNVTFSCFGEFSLAEGNINQNPWFVDPDGPDNDPETYDDNNYRLLSFLGIVSPCIDSGKNEDWMWEAFDLDGDFRVFQGSSSLTVDMGAYEHGSPRFEIVKIEKPPFSRVQCKLTWNTRPGDTCVVWSRPRFPTGRMIIPWTEEATVVSEGETTSWTDAVMSPQKKFYRVELRR